MEQDFRCPNCLSKDFTENVVSFHTIYPWKGPKYHCFHCLKDFDTPVDNNSIQ